MFFCFNMLEEVSIYIYIYIQNSRNERSIYRLYVVKKKNYNPHVFNQSLVLSANPRMHRARIIFYLWEILYLKLTGTKSPNSSFGVEYGPS